MGKLISQQKIADRVGGVSKMTVSHWESGRSTPSKELIQRIAAAYELDAEDLALAVYGLYYEDDTSAQAPRLEAATA